MLAHAQHGRFCGEKERFFRERVIRTLLRNDFKLRLRICEILAAIIKLRQFHSNFGSEGGLPMLLEESLCKLNDFRVISASCLFYPDAEIVGPFCRSSGRCTRGCVIQIFACFIQTWWRRMKRQLGQAHPSLRYTRIIWKIVNESLKRCPGLYVVFSSLHQTFLKSQVG